MSHSDTTSDSDSAPSLATSALRTVTPGTRGHPNAGMDAFGWGVFLGLVVLFVPLLPFLAIVWVVTKLAGWLDPRT